ncbi:hypothetical protein C0992_008124 [Termitomyces sp. T32_za158]|nr:hypothetical protein C0992_008124 [Termitomyces sp. T32_za158]
MGKLKASGVSCKFRIKNLEVPQKNGRSHRLGLNDFQRERERAQDRYEQNIQGLSKETRQILAEIWGSSTSEGTFPVDDNNNQPDGWEDEPMPDVPQEYLDFAARDIIDTRRTWRQRIQRLQQNWAPLKEPLADLYLE